MDRSTTTPTKLPWQSQTDIRTQELGRVMLGEHHKVQATMKPSDMLRHEAE